MKLRVEPLEQAGEPPYRYGLVNTYSENGFEHDEILHIYDTEKEAFGAKDLLAGDFTLPDRVRIGESVIIVPLYPQYGGPPLGFSCGQCQDVTKTKIGIWRHLWRKHKIKLQLEMFPD